MEHSSDAAKGDQAADRRLLTPLSSPAQAFVRLLADLGSSRRRGHESSPNRRPSDAKPFGAEPLSETWRDQLLADIEEHIAELKGRLTRFAAFRSLLSSNETASPDSEAVLERIHQSTEVTASAALASEMAYHEAFLLKPATPKQDLIRETDQQPQPGATG
ncbi:hypothetical protein QF036_004964 [Arthrobacter globiformis]|nr:hypothetical protein [Arthrobacter globiformis]